MPDYTTGDIVGLIAGVIERIALWCILIWACFELHHVRTAVERAPAAAYSITAPGQ